MNRDSKRVILPGTNEQIIDVKAVVAKVIV